MSLENKPTIDLKTQRYDRQLRLWATSGQAALENAKVCLLNATATGCEVLKNLILPGVGSITVVDDTIVDTNDMQSNFFLEPSDVSKSKAQAVVHLLKELNEAVDIQFVKKSPQALIHQDPTFFDAFTLIVASNVHETDIDQLARLCHDKILISVASKGLCGAFRIQAHQHTIIETHPENASDLRLAQPFQQLLDYVTTFDLDALDQTDHAHVPFIIVLLIFVDKWKQQHNGQPPQSYAERTELKQLIKDAMRTIDEENFEEAVANLWRLTESTKISSDIQAIFDHPGCILTPQSSTFWVLARAVRDFVANEGQSQLPLPGKLPDMKSDTKNYIGLQNAYRAKAVEDLEHITRRVHALLDEYQISHDALPLDVIDTFCKNAAHIKLIEYRTITDELEQPKTTMIENLLSSDENMAYYIIFRAADRFFTEHQRYPGALGDDVDDTDEVGLLKDQVLATLASMGIADANTLIEDHMIKAITNYVRFRNKETANLAALMGGLVAQEAIKLITHQYIPINNTCVFNGIASTSSVFIL